MQDNREGIVNRTKYNRANRRGAESAEKGKSQIFSAFSAPLRRGSIAILDDVIAMQLLHR